MTGIGTIVNTAAILAGGGLKTGTAGASISGAVETGWSVLEGGAAGEIITISNWS